MSALFIGLAGSRTSTRPPFGRSTGTEVYVAFESWVSARGAERVELGVVLDNQRALTFWKHLGFEVFDVTRPRTFGDKQHEVLKLARRLQP